MDEYISSPRPMWDPESTKETPTKRIITIGSNNSGVVVRITKKGVEFNGYYAGIKEAMKFANMREFAFITWDDFDSLRKDVFRKKPIKKEKVIRDPDSIDEKPDHKYLDSLPKVTLNGVKYYFDVERKERRPVHNPTQVFNFESQAAKTPS